jgi:hypothetical protein
MTGTMAEHREPLLVVRYGGSFVWVQIGMGVIGLLWSPVLASVFLHQPTFVFGPITIFGALMVLGGLLMARGSALVTVEDGCFVKHALVGPLRRRYPFDSWGEVSYVGGRVHVAGKKLPFSRTGARADDWSAFEALLAEKLR